MAEGVAGAVTNQKNARNGENPDRQCFGQTLNSSTASTSRMNIHLNPTKKMPPRSTPLQLCAAYRMFLRPSLSLTSRRAFHARIAELVMANKNGRLMKRKIEVTVGDADEAYVILDKEEGFSMKRAIGKQIDLSSIADPEKVPLTFYHDSRHFQHRKPPISIVF